MTAVARLLLSQREAAEMLGVSQRTLLAEIDAARLRYVLVGKRRKFKPGDLESYIERQGRGWREESDGSRFAGQGRRTGTATSRFAVYDFEAVSKRLTRMKRRS
jgi:excisionase family DNA binding protein